MIYQILTRAVILLLVSPLAALAQQSASAPVQITLAGSESGRSVPAEFIGLSFEMQRLLPGPDGRHYFRPDNRPLLTMFRTLGVKCLRIGGNTADRPTVPFPSTSDIDQLFAFARKAGVKVIFTLRFREGDPRFAGAVAKHIVDRYADLLWCFAIGNEPNVFAPEYSKFLAAWKQFAGIVNSPEFAPAARFAGPSSTAGKTAWTRDFARELSGTGRLLVATQHIYPGGNSDLVKDPAEGRRLMLSREWVAAYQKFHDDFVPAVLATRIPYRLAETNSFWNGGRKDASDTFTAAIWALDYMHWWAERGANGLNFHTGDFVARGEENTRCMYAAFWTTDEGYAAKPVAYGLKAFDIGGRGRLIAAIITANPQNLNLTAYARSYRGILYLTLINKEYGPGAAVTNVAVAVRPGARTKAISLTTADGDIASSEGITLGGEVINETGYWNGQWQRGPSANASGQLVISVPPASAIVIRAEPDKRRLVKTLR